MYIIGNILNGSHTYQLNNEQSDNDYLVIYVPSVEQEMSFIWEHHNLQYKTDDTDYIFTTIDNLLRNIITGDMPLLFELIHDVAIKDTEIGFLYDLRDRFNTFNTIRSYLGYAKRDLSHALKDDKRLCHAWRGIDTAKQLLNQENYDNFKSSPDKIAYMRLLKEGHTSRTEKVELCNHLTEECKALRSEVNDQLNKGLLTKALAVQDQVLIDFQIKKIKMSDSYQINQLTQRFKDMSVFYDAIENGVNY